MTSPFSSNLLQQTVDASSDAAVQPRPTGPSRSVTRVVSAPQPMPMPQQVVYVPTPSGPGAVSTLTMSLLVILLGAVALVGGYYATKQASPSPAEAAVVSSIAVRDGFRAGRDRGVDAGRAQVLETTSTTTALRAAAAREEAYAAAFRRGEAAGRRSYRAPRYTGGSGYRAPTFGFGNYAVASALGQAQQLANVTGAPVDVEVY